MAALFNNCVDCFEYIQLGRHFGRDYERCQLKIDIAQARLSRRGEAVAINEDSRFDTASPADKTTQQTQSILESIDLLFQSAQKVSKRYELGAKQDVLALFRVDDMQPVFQRLHGHLASMVRQRQKQTSLVKKAAWALYDGKNFDRLVEQITGLVDELEKVYPVEAARRRLAQMEIEEVDDEPALAALEDAAVGVDKILAEAATQKVEGTAVKNHAGKVDTREKARVQVGNEFAEAILGRGVGITDQTTNTVDTVDSQGNSRVQVGNRYGGRGIFDD